MQVWRALSRELRGVRPGAEHLARPPADGGGQVPPTFPSRHDHAVGMPTLQPSGLPNILPRYGRSNPAVFYIDGVIVVVAGRD